MAKPSPIPFVAPLGDVSYGSVEQLSPLVQRVIAHNPSKYTYMGTGTYIVGDRSVAVIDPGPALDTHRDALQAALAGRTVEAILITHTHGDHSPLARWMREEFGAPTYGFGPHGEVGEPEPDDADDADDAEDDAAAASPPDSPDEPKETIDIDFVPQHVVGTGSRIIGHGWTFEAIHTPGHTSNHVCYALAEEATLFSGDHVMGWSTAVISPPDGDMRAYCASLQLLIDRGTADRLYRPTHGGPILDPIPFVSAYLAHRLERERRILEMISVGVGSITDIVDVLYADVRKELHRAAGRSVFAHITKLIADGAVAVEGGLKPTLRATYLPT